ncbi:MAG: ATP-binding protein [Candidatus Acidiferrales bacterium]|jgi:signal transduction histidine kinase
MAFLFYVRLIVLTAGTLVYLFLIALILGHRRPRFFERLLFFLVLSLFAIYAGGLLEINARIQYGTPPEVTRLFYSSLIALGVLLLIPLVAQTHLEYFRQVRQDPIAGWALSLAYSLYLLPAAMLVFAAVIAHAHPKLGFGGFLGTLVRESGFIILVSAMVAAPFQWILAKSAPDRAERSLFRGLCAASLLVVLCLLFLGPSVGIPPWTAAAVAGVFSGALLIYYALKHNFLDFGAQRNLVYALSATLLALLYLALVHRISGWLAPVFPPEATASVLLFVLIFLFEPLERAIGPALHRTFRERMDRWQRLAVELQEQARHGDVGLLIAAAERRIREEFSLAAVRISVPREPSQKPLESPGGLGHVVRIPLKKGREEIGTLEAASTGSYLTGETTAAIEFLAEQLPAMIDLCRLIEEKVRLERELAERERLALLGQMAATVSHNLRNPLGSMKTVLQVQLENPHLPPDLRHDCTLVLGEIDRMGTKLTELLHFTRPSVNGRRVGAVALAREAATLFRHDAERRNVQLEFEAPAEEATVLASEEALNEILSNLVVNAIEAQPNGGRVRVGLARNGDQLEIRVEDEGPGIPTEARAKMFQPFFTTKATGTGLGLAIVARRVAEMGGTIACESPVNGRKGTRFRVTLPVAAGG